MGGPGEAGAAPVTMAGVGPPPAGPECLVQAVLMEVLVILVSSGDKQADRAVVEAVWELLHEFDAMCQLLSNIRSPCLPLAKASMQLLTKMHHSKRFSLGPRSVLQVCFCSRRGHVYVCGVLVSPVVDTSRHLSYSLPFSLCSFIAIINYTTLINTIVCPKCEDGCFINADVQHALRPRFEFFKRPH